MLPLLTNTSLFLQNLSMEVAILEANMATVKNDAELLRANEDDESMKNTFILLERKMTELQGDVKDKLTKLKVCSRYLLLEHFS